MVTYAQYQASEMVTSAQLRAARALLNCTVRDLAELSGVHRNTITRAETEATGPGHAVAQIVHTLEAAGVEFIAENGGGPGVRLWKATADVKETKSGYRVEVALPGNALPHILKDDFGTESEAKAWAASDKGRAFTDELGKRWWGRRQGSEREQ
jgi:transcriptional regulator with XRE-family HTH domain